MPHCAAAIPIVHVTSSEAATAFLRALGFEPVSVYRSDPSKVDPSYSCFRRDTAELHVSSFAGVSGMGIYIWVDDIDALHREFTEKGVPIIGPFDQTWGTREFAVRDADQNTFGFGQRRKSP
jgi:catechol 2,3-dioxygenase-like lactoylglutathione lyase family enzyme